MEIITKKYPIVSITAGILAITLIASAVTGEGSVISGAMIQAGWCGQRDYICLFWRYVEISIIILIIALIIQLIVNGLNNKKGAEPNQRITAKSKKQSGDVTVGNIVNKPTANAGEHGNAYAANRDLIINLGVDKSKAQEHEKEIDRTDSRSNWKSHAIREDEQGEHAWEIISEREYGSARFAKKLHEANHGRITLPRGTFISSTSSSFLNSVSEAGRKIREYKC